MIGAANIVWLTTSVDGVITADTMKAASTANLRFRSKNRGVTTPNRASTRMSTGS